MTEPEITRLRPRTPWRAAFMANRFGDLDRPALELVTIQSREVAESIMSGRRHAPDPTFVDPAFAEATRWLVLQMNELLPSSGASTVWLWARIPRRSLRTHLRMNRGDVVLRCRVPRERVLLTGFGDWHVVLNHAPFVAPAAGERDQDYEARLDEEYERIARRLAQDGLPANAEWSSYPIDLQRSLEAGWKKMISTPITRGAAVQATAHYLDPDDVRDAFLIL